jgi:hypothetical protein
MEITEAPRCLLLNPLSLMNTVHLFSFPSSSISGVRKGYSYGVDMVYIYPPRFLSGELWSPCGNVKCWDL